VAAGVKGPRFLSVESGSVDAVERAAQGFRSWVNAQVVPTLSLPAEYWTTCSD